jgi:hypothetical protein
VKKSPLQVPQRGLHGERRPSPEPSFTCLSKSPAKEPLLHVPLSEPLTEGRSVSRVFFYLSLKVPGEEIPPPSSPNGAPMKRDAGHQSLLLHIFQSPQ